MTPDEILEELRATERTLYKPAVHEFIRGQAEDVRTAFATSRGRISEIVGGLTNAQLALVAADLEQLTPDLEEGIASLEECVARLDDAIALVNAVASLLNLAARVAALVA